MEAFLLRDEAPLSEAEWEKLDALVVRAAQKILVGRRFLHLHGPLGAGVQVTPLDTFAVEEACIHFVGGESCSHEACPGGCEPIGLSGRTYLPLPVLHKDFQLLWRDVVTTRQMEIDLELAPAAAAAVAVARIEDHLIFRGYPDHGLTGLLNVEGTKVPLEDWGEPGSAFANVAAARSALVHEGFYGPYALILSPGLYTLTHRLYRNSGRLEIQQIETVASAGVFQTPILEDQEALLVSVGPQNLDLVVAQDMITAYLGPEGMDHHFRVLESLVLRIKRPGAICALEA